MLSGMAQELPTAFPPLFDHPEPNYVITPSVCEFWSVVTTVPIAGLLFMFQAFRMNLGWRVKVLSIWVFTMYCCACFSHASLITPAFRVTVGLVASQGCFVFSQYSYLVSLQLGNISEPIAVVLEAIIVAAVALIPQQLGARGGHLSLGVIQTPPVFLGLVAAGHIHGYHKVLVYDKLIASGRLLLFAMALSFLEYYLWDSAPSVLPIFGGFPLVHVTIHVVEQIGIYMYALSVAILDAGEMGRILSFAPDPFLGILPVVVEAAQMQPQSILRCSGSKGLKRKHSDSGDLTTDEHPAKQRKLVGGAEWIPVVDVSVLLDPEVRKNHPEFNKSLHELYPDAGVIRVLGEKSCFLVKSRRLVRQILKDEANFSSHPWPDGRVIALNTMTGSKHTLVKKLLMKFYSPSVASSFKHHFQHDIMESLRPDRGKSFCAVTWAGRLHMAGALRVLGGKEAESIASSPEMLDHFVQMNDDMVRLVAPLGGIGKPAPGLWPSFAFLKGLVRALPPLFGLMRRIGFGQTYAIMRPELNLYQGPCFPRTGTRQHPELLPEVPRYFAILDKLLTGTPRDSQRGEATTCLEALRDAEADGLLSRAECLGVLVQMMVNMTTRNAFLNALHRLAEDKELCTALRADRTKIKAFLHEVLRVDTPLQRTPKRALQNTHLDGTFIPKGSTVLCLLGAANMSPEGCVGDPSRFCPFDGSGSNDKKESLVTFGPGSRQCLGQHLVMMEMESVVEFVLDNAPNLTVDGPTMRVNDVDVGNFGWSKLNLVF